MSGATQKVPHRTLITLCVMMGNLMQSLDASIANVSLPYMQGTLATSADEITWVLTSYVIAAAIMTAPVGWMAVRFGRKNLHVTCMTGFVIASMLCGTAEFARRRWCASASCKGCAAPRWCRCRRPRCSTSTRSSAAPRRWRSSAWA